MHRYSPPSSKSITRPYSYQPRRPIVVQPTQHRHTRRFRPAFTIIVIGVAIISLWGVGAHIIRAAAQRPPTFNAVLATQVNAVLQQHNSYQISVSLRDIQTGEAAHYGDAAAFDAASTAKVLTACAYYHLVEQGKASLNAPLGYYNAQFNLESMINDSNNDAWHLLTDTIGVNALENYATSIGLHYDTDDNTLTSNDVALLLDKLYSGKLLNTADTKQLLSYMQNTNDETLIPAALPSDVTVYHKYGLLDGSLHDASIIVKNGHAYSFVVYTKNTDDSDDSARTAVIHQLTQIVTKQLFGA
jgi:beta-lactamase class A